MQKQVNALKTIYENSTTLTTEKYIFNFYLLSLWKGSLITMAAICTRSRFSSAVYYHCFPECISLLLSYKHRQSHIDRTLNICPLLESQMEIYSLQNSHHILTPISSGDYWLKVNLLHQLGGGKKPFSGIGCLSFFILKQKQRETEPSNNHVNEIRRKIL